MQPKAQLGLPKELAYGPTNRKTFDMLPTRSAAQGRPSS